MSRRGARSSANVKPGQFNPDPEAQLRLQELESDRALKAPGSSTRLSIRWLKLGRLKIPIGLSLGLKLGGSFRGKKRRLDLPPPSGKTWDSEKGRFL